MKTTEVSGQRAQVRNQRLKRSRKIFVFFCLLTSVFCFPSCSIPSLEKPECAAAREAAREFYSFHYSSDTKFTRENLRQREKFLTPELFQNLMRKTEGGKDYFTDSEEPPKAFRIGGCRVIEPNRKVNFGVVLIWKDDDESLQKEVKVEAVKQNDSWLINSVENQN